ncbi:MAG: divalent metal cation transporter, partial [Acidobacteriota bacterium]
MHRLLSLLAGAVIAAAFLGPGTITTAARAGAGHGASLLWALVFATVACFLLQEAAARSTLASGQPLAAALRRRYAGGWRGAAVLGLVLAAVIVGCAAYEAGNILGGVAGAEMALGIDRRVLTAVAAVAAAVLLSLGGRATVSAVLAGLVATMGVAFTVTALRLGIDSGEVVRGAVVPTVPVGAWLLVLGLVGTTVVPYNLFLGSGLAAGSTEDRRVALRDARHGLAVAIGLGGLVSMAG